MSCKHKEKGGKAREKELNLFSRGEGGGHCPQYSSVPSVAGYKKHHNSVIEIIQDFSKISFFEEKIHCGQGN